MVRRGLEPEDVSEQSDTPEEVSNASKRRVIKASDKIRKQVQKEKQRLRKPREVRVKDDDDQETHMPSADAAITYRKSALPVASTSTSHLLDPSLFAASFAKSKSFVKQPSQAQLDERITSSIEPNKRKKGLAKGRDGQPMKRLKDGRTTIRVLAEQRPISDESVEKVEMSLPTPAPVDSLQVMPNAKVRAFHKHKLGLREGLPVRSAPPASTRREDDPLGLQDPAFMKGGEFEHLSGGAGKIDSKPKPVARRRGGRTKFAPPMSKQGQALNFARSM